MAELNYGLSELALEIRAMVREFAEARVKPVRAELDGACAKYGVDRIVMIAPTSEDRIQMLAIACAYHVRRTGKLASILGDLRQPMVTFP